MNNGPESPEHVGYHHKEIYFLDKTIYILLGGFLGYSFQLIVFSQIASGEQLLLFSSRLMLRDNLEFREHLDSIINDPLTKVVGNVVPPVVVSPILKINDVEVPLGAAHEIGCNHVIVAENNRGGNGRDVGLQIMDLREEEGEVNLLELGFLWGSGGEGNLGGILPPAGEGGKEGWLMGEFRDL
uniref:Uncharacterized protein n=1 Tax=Arcella intermedia TaxID=1963864 RepID=A0A6B2LHI3_9EUKA